MEVGVGDSNLVPQVNFQPVKSSQHIPVPVKSVVSSTSKVAQKSKISYTSSAALKPQKSENVDKSESFDI